MIYPNPRGINTLHIKCILYCPKLQFGNFEIFDHHPNGIQMPNPTNRCKHVQHFIYIYIYVAYMVEYMYIYKHSQNWNICWDFKVFYITFGKHSCNCQNSVCGVRWGIEGLGFECEFKSRSAHFQWILNEAWNVWIWWMHHHHIVIIAEMCSLCEYAHMM